MKPSFLMSSIQHIKNIHFIAICGTGMGTLALLLKQKGFQITGSDQSIYPPMSTNLEQNNIQIFSGYDSKNIPSHVDLVIIGNAVSKTNPEVEAVLEKSLTYMSMPEAVSEFLIQDKKSIVIAGTHGKTTTTSLGAFLLSKLAQDPSYLIGGILNQDFPHYKNGNGDLFVIEGDEYDSAFFDKEPKFLHYKPYYTLITSMEFDHADIYDNFDQIKQSFKKLIKKTHPQGKLFLCAHYQELNDLASDEQIEKRTYGIDCGDWQARNSKFFEDRTEFDLFFKDEFKIKMISPLSGKHNILNTVGMIGLLNDIGFDLNLIHQALLTFPGIKRRQEVRAIIDDKIIIDDFAHHPTAVKETIRAIQEKYKNRPVWAIFEPRSNTSMRQVFQAEFANALRLAQFSIVADVFNPQKIKNGTILDVKRLESDINQNPKSKKAVHISGVENIVEFIKEHSPKNAVILVMSNGGFENIHDRLIKELST